MLDTLSELAKRGDEAAADQRPPCRPRSVGTNRRGAVKRPAVRQRSKSGRSPSWTSVAPLGGGAGGIGTAGRRGIVGIVERYEANGRAEDGRRLAICATNWRKSAVPSDNELARRIESHYRNANLRIALSAQLINRLLPEQKTVEAPVNDTILGTPIRGRSTTSTQLNVRLLPNPRTWQFAFEAAGNVDFRRVRPTAR